MPKFMDVHTSLKLPAEAIADLRKATVSGERDEFDVAQLELYYNDDGMVYCLTEAPDKESVIKHHEGAGIPCDAVHQVNSLL